MPDHMQKSVTPGETYSRSLTLASPEFRGTFPQPGEISPGHNGVLFLDELPEFKRTVLEVMRQPLEDRIITISRAKSTCDYPASLRVVNLNGLSN